MSHLIISVETIPGHGIKECCESAVRIASKLNSTVKFTFNGVVCFAKPYSDPAKLVSNWEKAYDRNGAGRKVAST